MNISHRQEQGAIRRLFSRLWSMITWIRVALANILFLILLLIIVIAIGGRSAVVLPEEFALRVAPMGMLVDQRTYVDPMSILLGDVTPEESETVVRDLVNAINYAANDQRVTALVLELDLLLGGGISKLQEVGQALENFKTSGKKIVAFGDNYTQDQYYLASYADEIYLNNMGAVLITGYGSYRQYFKNALDKLKINFHIFRTGSFKDAVEPLLRDDMSEESKEHNLRWLNQLWSQYTQRVEQARNLPAGSINDYVNNMDVKLRATQGDTALMAMEAGLITGLRNYQEAQEALIAELGKSDEGNFYQGVDFDLYLDEVTTKQIPNADSIGLVVASGAVMDGEQPDGTIGSHTLAKILQDIREEKAVKALVLRIDSGGGSAFASEAIRVEIAATREAGIPVFISMGSLAASGGYWIAAGGDEIWATPTTLTGSIGVFAAFPTFENSLAHLGLHTDGVATTELAGAMRPDRELSPTAITLIQLGVDHIYQRFLTLVAEARSASVEDIDAIAQGRVWSGANALELGLVDHTGTLNDVIAAAAAHVDVSDYSVRLYSRQLSAKEELLRQIFGSSASSLAPRTWLHKFTALEVQQALIPLIAPLKALMKMNDPKAIYASCLDCMAP